MPCLLLFLPPDGSFHHLLSAPSAPTPACPCCPPTVCRSSSCYHLLPALFALYFCSSTCPVCPQHQLLLCLPQTFTSCLPCLPFISISLPALPALDATSCQPLPALVSIPSPALVSIPFPAFVPFLYLRAAEACRPLPALVAAEGLPPWHLSLPVCHHTCMSDRHTKKTANDLRASCLT
ncbi:hypothetical protein DUNSADRAFT_68 [Dunaliella salina]|uniref:Encoded protein n=1 Tax=Dunaliella salina TaxID=3046 RepID=A0ABQ7H8T4_DUNSA|nr:hypothetical protein DUNSADRAFT_68 [Dunaliella salina]|eukprot:KAF5843266.1 hypothetical protein DUNSADRAFT_68 [Dunaliella salina]